MQTEGPKIGSLVEIQRGRAWYEGAITQTQTQTNQQNFYTVKPTSSNSPFPTIGTVNLSMIRPRPPCKRSSLSVFEVFQKVEGFYKDGWWSGVVVNKHFQNDDLSYSVFVLEIGEEIWFKAINLRKRMEWIKGNWVPAEEVAAYEDKMHLMFDEGKRVEVSSNRHNYGASWYEAVVLKMIGKSYFLVEYATLKRNNDTSSLQEIVHVQRIRPCPPVSEKTGFKEGDTVEVLDEGGWILGVIRAILPMERYVVKISKDQEGEPKVLDKTSLRPYFVWSDDRWDMISKDVDAQDVEPINLVLKGKKTAFTGSNESHTSSQSTKKMKIVNEVSSKQDGHHPSKDSSCNSENVCNTSIEFPSNGIVTQSSGASNIKDDQSCLIKHVHNTLEKDKSKGSETPSSKCVSVTQSNKIESPFSLKEKDKLSKLVESTNEVLCLFPQEPHFRPLLQHEKIMREGLACGITMAFAGLVTDLRSCALDVSQNEIEEKMKALDSFKEHGFSIRPVQTFLDNLMMLRKRLDELEGKKKSTAAELEKVLHEKEKDNSLLSEIEKKIIALNEQKTSVILKMKKYDFDIVNLESDARTVEDDIADANGQLNAILTAPW